MQHRLIWFRDDLRVNDNSAVSAALNCSADTRISAVFLTADDEWESFGYGKNRLHYTEQLLRSSRLHLRNMGYSCKLFGSRIMTLKGSGSVISVGNRE